MWVKIWAWLKKLFTGTPTVVVPDAEPLDAIDLTTVVFDDKNISTWPITASLSGVRITAGGGIKADLITGTDKWPVRADGGTKPSIGNWWIFALCNDGKWHGATVEYYKRGALGIVGRGWAGEDAIHGAIGTDFRPVTGTVAYVAISGCARGAPYTIEKRSQVVKVVWP